MPDPFREIRAEIDELRRRLRTLESAARMPNLTTGGQEGIQIASVAAAETRNVGAWGDLATYGPEVVVRVTGTGVLLVCMTAYIAHQANADTYMTGEVSFRIAGPNGYVLAPGGSRALAFDAGYGADLNQSTQMRAGLIEPVTGLWPGDYTVTAKYFGTAATNPPTFKERRLVAIPL